MEGVLLVLLLAKATEKLAALAAPFTSCHDQSWR